MADITVTAASVLASVNAKKKTGVAGAAITAGEPLYADSSDSHKLKPADGAAAASDLVAGIALHDAADEQPITYVYDDPAFTPGATLVIGTTYALSDTAGGIAPIADILTGDYVTILGVATTTAVMILKIINSGVAVP